MLQSKTSTECAYLDDATQLKHAALFISSDSARGRAVYGLHLPPTGRCHASLDWACALGHMPACHLLVKDG